MPGFDLDNGLSFVKVNARRKKKYLLIFNSDPWHNTIRRLNPGDRITASGYFSDEGESGRVRLVDCRVIDLRFRHPWKKKYDVA